MCAKLHNESGLTLLEVMVSMLITTIGILGLAPLIVLSINDNNTSRGVMEAASLAKEKIEMFENLDTLPALPFVEKEANLGDGYYRITQIRENTTDTTLPAGIAFMNVEVSWVDQAGTHQSTSYSTILEKE